MRKTLLVLFIVFTSTASMLAQDIYLGPYVLLKGGTNVAGVPDGLKTSANFNGIPDFGLTARWMFDKYSNLGVVLDFGYSTYSFRVGPDNADQATDASTIIFKPSYITVVPSIYLSGFTLGFAFGFPAAYSVMSATGDDKSGQFLANVKDINGPLIELRVGGMIPVLKSEKGILSILVQGGYMLTGMVDNTYWEKYSSTFKDEANNPKVLSLGVGVNYLFNLSEL
jgi:hypothetical protein